MQLEAPARKSLSKPRARPAKPASNPSYSEEEDEEEEEEEEATHSAPPQKRIPSVRGAKIVKKKPQNVVKRPSTPPRRYDSEEEQPAATKPRPASAKPAKRVSKRAPSPAYSDEEDEEEMNEVKPAVSRRKSSAGSGKAVRARKREEPQEPSDDEGEEPIDEVKPEPRRPSVGKGRKSVGPSTENTQDMLAAAREAAQREMQARAESRIGTLGGSPDPKSKRKRP